MSDLTARATVRDCAIAVFARDGFAASVRTIAEAAGVSPGLVIHHFGSKDGLRAECDDHVLELTRARNLESLREPAADEVSLDHQLTGLAAAFAGKRADIDKPVGFGHQVHVVLDQQHGVAGVDEAAADVQNRAALGRVEARGGLVQHIGNAEEPGAQLGRQAQALQLTAG